MISLNKREMVINIMDDYLQDNEQDQILSVKQLTDIIKGILEAPPFRNLKVTGEVSNYSLSSTGHLFFSLKDESKSLLRCTMWKSTLEKQALNFKDGDKVICSGYISVYPPSGSYQLIVSKIEKQGLGDLWQKFEELKHKLQQEGLFEQSHKKKIPSYPFNIGIITAETGAAVQDIINILQRRAPFANIFLFPCQVQGENAAMTIADRIRKANEYSQTVTPLDVLIIGRGGGSLEDLWAFNEEIVAYAVYNSELPVISAVGHEIDLSISDFVADLRAPTPSAAAEMITNNFIYLKDYLNNAQNNLSGSLLKLLKYKKSLVDPKIRIPILEKSLTKKIDSLYFFLSSTSDKINMKFDHKLSGARETLINCNSLLQALSPNQVLKRGYTLVKKGEKLITRSSRLSENDRIKIIFYDKDKNAVITD